MVTNKLHIAAKEDSGKGYAGETLHDRDVIHKLEIRHEGETRYTMETGHGGETRHAGGPHALSLRLIRQWWRVSVGYLLLLGLLGVFLRLLFIYPIEGVVYRNFLHAHSHIAFLGWIFNALMAGIVYAFIPNRAPSYKWVFILLQVSVVGMLISFPIQGYALYSILFSSLHIFFSWWFAAKVFRDLKQSRLEVSQQKHMLSRTFIKWALFFMVLSSIGPFALGGIMAQGMAGSDWYQLAIYFYLHFQYDGWFSFAIFGLACWLLEKHHIPFNRLYARAFLWVMALACIPAYALSSLWTEPAAWVYAVAGISAAAQLVALALALFMGWHIRKPLAKLFSGKIRLAMQLALFSYGLKILMQLASALPSIAQLAYQVRNFTIGYLHLVFLGFVSFFLLGWFARQGFLQLQSRSAKAGLYIFLAGFILTELYLFGQPLSIRLTGEVLPAYAPGLALASLLLPIGTALLMLNIKPDTAISQVKQHERKLNKQTMTD